MARPAALLAGYRTYVRYGVSGLSVTFHPGYTLDQLAQAAHLPHLSISYATVQAVQQALTQAGYDLILASTPTATNPDHHTLGVGQGGVNLPTLPPSAANALASVLRTAPNPHPAR